MKIIILDTSAIIRLYVPDGPLPNGLEEHVTSAKTFINNKMYRAAEEELRCIGAIEEKLAENKLRIKEMCKTVPIIERIRNGATYMEENNDNPKYVAMNSETKDELFKELKESRVTIPMTLSVPGGKVEMYGLELIIKENIPVGHIKIIGDDIK